MSYYPFGTDDFRRVLQGDGRKVVKAGKGLLTNCLVHADHDPSAEVFPDGWMCCYSCGKRYHISNYYPELRDPEWKPEKKLTYKQMPKPIEVPDEPKKEEYTRYNLFDIWLSLPAIPRTHTFKRIPLEVLDELGWRWTDGTHGMGAGYLIPYFNHDKTSVPFAQVRHLEGSRRFTFLPGAEVKAYGIWNLIDGEKVFIVEGSSDGAVLEMCMVPWVAIPSSSCGTMLSNLARYCLKHSISIIYAGDNDEAGEKLRLAIDDVAPYRICQPPKKYKDWGDYLEAEGAETVSKRLYDEYMEPVIPPMVALAEDIFTKG